jgi:hypothetical protein
MMTKRSEANARRRARGKPSKSRANEHNQLAVAKPLLRPGEKLLLHYCCDVMACHCPATHTHSSVPCGYVGRKGKVDRCLMCGTAWAMKVHRGGAKKPQRVMQTEDVDRFYANTTPEGTEALDLLLGRIP